MPYDGYAVSVRGASHEEDGSTCQDSARVFIGEKYSIAAVSDGHGSKKHFRSASGSEMATRTAVRSIMDFYERNGGLLETICANPDEAVRRIAANIICCWNNEIAAHLRVMPLNHGEREIFDKYGGIPNEVMYGATLLLAYADDTGYFGMQIGDGSFTVRQSGAMISPMPADDRLVGNLTTSLCDSDAIGGFRYVLRQKPCESIMLSSDGLINSFVSTKDFLRFGLRVTGGGVNIKDLAAHLKLRSGNGSRDDISIAALIVKN